MNILLCFWCVGTHLYVPCRVPWFPGNRLQMFLTLCRISRRENGWMNSLLLWKENHLGQSYGHFNEAFKKKKSDTLHSNFQINKYNHLQILKSNISQMTFFIGNWTNYATKRNVNITEMHSDCPSYFLYYCRYHRQMQIVLMWML